MTYAFSLKDKKVWVAGHTGMVGSAIVRRLENENCQILKATREKLDLTKLSVRSTLPNLPKYLAVLRRAQR
mgnify:CR=1 FL=1